MRFDAILGKQVIAWTSDAACDFQRCEGTASGLTSAQMCVIEKELKIQPRSWIAPSQVHGDIIWEVGEDDLVEENCKEADAVVTSLANVAIAIRTADCLPIFLFDPVQGVVAVVHAGWRSSEKEIARKVLERMTARWQSRPRDVRAVFGPAIQGDVYEVRAEFQRRFPNGVIYREDRWHLDLPRVNRDQLMTAGVSQEHIYDCGECTFKNQDFFSYRRQGPVAGRMISLIMRRG